MSDIALLSFRVTQMRDQDGFGGSGALSGRIGLQHRQQMRVECLSDATLRRPNEPSYPHIMSAVDHVLDNLSAILKFSQ